MYNPPTPEEKKLHTHVGGHDNSIVDSSRSIFFDDRSYLTRTTFHFLAFSNTQFPELKCKHLSNAEKRLLDISQCELILCLYIQYKEGSNMITGKTKGRRQKEKRIFNGQVP